MAVSKLVTFEGGDRCGKTTQRDLFRTWYDSIKDQIADAPEIVYTREPGGTELGQELREMILHREGVSVRTRLMLYLADRAQHVATVIKPALATGKIVICDRFIDSTLAYQGFAGNLGMQEVAAAHSLATGGIWPAHTIWLDTDPADSMKRVAESGAADQIESRGFAFHSSLHQGFETLARRHPDRIHRIPPGDIQSIHEAVRFKIASWILPWETIELLASKEHFKPEQLAVK